MNHAENVVEYRCHVPSALNVGKISKRSASNVVIPQWSNFTFHVFIA